MNFFAPLPPHLLSLFSISFPSPSSFYKYWYIYISKKKFLYHCKEKGRRGGGVLYTFTKLDITWHHFLDFYYTLWVYH